MAIYRYLFADMMTGDIIAELPLQQVSFQRLLNGAGAFNALLKTGDSKVSALDWVDAVQEARTAIWVDRDGVLQWGGVLWTVRPATSKGASQGLRLKGAETWSYYARRFFTVDRTWANADQAQIVSDIVTWAQSVSGSYSVTVPAVVNTGITRSLVLTADQFVNIAQEIQDLAAMYQGLDFAIDWQYVGTPGTPTATLNVSYPRRGLAAASSNLVFELPGNIVDYDWPRDGSVRADTVHAVGSGSGPSMLRSSTTNTALLTAGYPLLEAVTSYKDVRDQAILDGHATSDINLLSQPSELSMVSVRADADPILGQYTVGDEARFLLTNEDWPAPTGGGAGKDANYRITGYTVYPPDAGTQQQYETVKLQLGPVWSP